MDRIMIFHCYFLLDVKQWEWVVMKIELLDEV